METLFGSYVGPLGSSGLLGNQRTALTKENASLTQQISDLDRRLVQRRSQLEAGFIAMEKAQSTIQQMQSQLSNAFPASSSSKK
jgi:flagellar capping protein FliD